MPTCPVPLAARTVTVITLGRRGGFRGLGCFPHRIGDRFGESRKRIHNGIETVPDGFQDRAKVPIRVGGWRRR
jgi:hypothetical protein